MSRDSRTNPTSTEIAVSLLDAVTENDKIKILNLKFLNRAIWSDCLYDLGYMAAGRSVKIVEGFSGDDLGRINEGERAYNSSSGYKGTKLSDTTPSHAYRLDLSRLSLPPGLLR